MQLEWNIDYTDPGTVEVGLQSVLQSIRGTVQFASGESSRDFQVALISENVSIQLYKLTSALVQYSNSIVIVILKKLWNFYIVKKKLPQVRVGWGDSICIYMRYYLYILYMRCLVLMIIPAVIMKGSSGEAGPDSHVTICHNWSYCRL